VIGTAMIMGPSLLGLFGSSQAARAAAEECGVDVGGAGKLPFVCLDLAGGASIAGSNVMVGGPGGQMDFLSPEGYSKLGLPSDLIPQLPGQLSTELGLAFHSDSAFLRGILSKTTATTRANVNGCIICARSENDTGNNPHNPMYGVGKAGAAGELVTLVGTQSSDSGGRSRVPDSMFDPALLPTKIDRPRDATGLVDTGKLVSLLDHDDAVAVMQAVERLSQQKVARLGEEQIVKDLLLCAYSQSTELVARYGDPGILDPLRDADIAGLDTSIFTATELERSEFRKAASVMKLVVNGFAGAGTIELGGYDYHDSTRATGERKDFAAGQVMGALLEYAARRSRPLLLYVFSDGSVASDGQLDNSADGRGKGIWKGDNSSTASVFMLVYDPNGQPRMRTSTANQIGYFRPSGSVETAATRVSDAVDLLAEAIVLNYLALHDEVGRLDEVLPNHGLGAGADLDSLVAFEPIV
jgi:hypothetical protein